jgi:hypothetical protein
MKILLIGALVALLFASGCDHEDRIATFLAR